MIPADALLAAAGRYFEPSIGRSLHDAGVPLTLGADGTLVVELGFPADGLRADLTAELSAQLRSEFGEAPPIEVRWAVQAHAARGAQPVAGVRNLIAVGSGKGGVGKSTVAVNLALALLAEGARVGLLDADVYGPSQPTMLGVSQRPGSTDGKHLQPVPAHGLQTMSIGYLVDPAQPVVWRGPMATQALSQLISDTVWDDLDYLILDLPPGTGDIQLSLAQRAPLAGAVVVTTPQNVALGDARKGLEMFRKVSVPVLGVVENMSAYHCPACGHEEAIFGSGGGASLARDSGAPLLGSIPLDPRIQRETDAGRPTMVAAPDSPIAAGYRAIARRVAAALAYGVAAADLPLIEVLDD